MTNQLPTQSDLVRLACEDLIKNVAKLAAEAEAEGAKPQGQELAFIARKLSQGEYEAAMQARDRILQALVDAKAGRRSDFGTMIVGSIAAVLVLGSLFYGAKVLIQDYNVAKAERLATERGQPTPK